MTFEREYAGGRMVVSPVSGARGADELPPDAGKRDRLGGMPATKTGRIARFAPFPCPTASVYCTAFIMSKIGRYMAITMPPTITPRITIMAGSMRERSALTATSTSSS